MSVIYDRVALIGLGLIAGSMAYAMRRDGLAREIVGTAQSAKTREIVKELGFCERIVGTAAEAVKDADLVVLAVPVSVMGAIAAEIGPYLKPGATVTDVGSVKRRIIDAVSPHIPEGVHFIPGHPLAGTEHSGPRSGFAELFENRWCLLIPDEQTDPQALAQLREFWEGVGSNVEPGARLHQEVRVCLPYCIRGPQVPGPQGRGPQGQIPDASQRVLQLIAMQCAFYLTTLAQVRR